MKTKKILCGVLALSTALTMFAGCGKKDTAEGGEINLKWVMSGPGKQADSDVVWGKWNELLKTYEGFENVNVDFEIIPSSDYSQKFLLMQTSGEAVDLANTYSGGSFKEHVENETFVDLTDMMEKYAPDVLKELPQWAIDMGKVDGRLYGLTNYQQMSAPMWGYIVEKAEADKYLDKENLEKVARSSDILTKEELDIFEKYFEDLKVNGELDHGMRPGSTWAMKGYASIPGAGNYMYRINSDKVVVENRIQLDTYKMITERFHDWFKKGYIRKDILSCEVNKGDYNMNHTQWHAYAENAWNIANADEKGEHYIIRNQDNFYLPESANSGYQTVMAVSEYPEKALSLLDLMFTEKGKDLYRMLVYGLEDQHYKMIGEDRIEPIGYTGTQGTSDAPYGLAKWMVGNTANAFETKADPEGWNDYVFNDWNKNAVPSVFAGVSIDVEPIQSKLDQINAVVSEYIDQLTSGAMTNWEATWEEATKKLEIAGNQECIDYLQKAVDEALGQ